jgi:hypothetical protein
MAEVWGRQADPEGLLMATETSASSTPANQELPDNLKSLSEEIATFFRELPRLLAEGEEGRIALIKGDKLLGTWDTLRDALQAGHERFGVEEPFMVQKISARDAERIARLVPGLIPVTDPANGRCQS